MERRDKINYYLDIAQTVSERGTCLRRNFGAIIVKTIRLFQRAITVRPAAGRIAPMLDTAPVKSLEFPVVSAMSSAVRFTRRQTPLLRLPDRICLAQHCIWLE